MRSWLVAFGSGLLFGVGLIVAGMTRPAKVVGFLDPLGPWDPSLAFVLIGAIGVHLVAYRLVPRLGRPLWARTWAIPTRRDLDWRLIVGAALFGAGWGIGGYCPGPALVAVASGATTTVAFVAAMALGMWAFAAWEASRAAAAPPSAAPARPALKEVS